MKNIRFVLLLGVGIMLAAVVLDFLDSRRTQANVGLKELQAIPSEFSSQSSRWSWSQTSGDSRKIEIFADSVRQTKETLLLELEGVELKIFREDGKSYDQGTAPEYLFRRCQKCDRCSRMRWPRAPGTSRKRVFPR